MAVRNILCVIPARGGSKGLVRKNVRLLGGRPLIAHTIDAAARSRTITRTVVSTDDEEIARLAAELGLPVPFLRAPGLASDDARQIDVVLDALHRTEEVAGHRYELIVLLQPTSPLRSVDDIDAAVKKAIDSNATSVVGVTVASEHPFYMCTLDGDRMMPMLKDPRMYGNRQDFPNVYRRNGAVYVVRRDVLVEEHNLYGSDCRAHIMPRSRSVNIDTELDLLMAELILRRAGESREDEGSPTAGS